MLRGSDHRSSTLELDSAWSTDTGRTRAQESPANPDQRWQGTEKGKQKEEELRPQLSEFLACSVLRLIPSAPYKL